jgi:hypothetical protein
MKNLNTSLSQALTDLADPSIPLPVTGNIVFDRTAKRLRGDGLDDVEIKELLNILFAGARKGGDV